MFFALCVNFKIGEPQPWRPLWLILGGICSCCDDTAGRCKDADHVGSECLYLTARFVLESYHKRDLSAIGVRESLYFQTCLGNVRPNNNNKNIIKNIVEILQKAYLEAVKMFNLVDPPKCSISSTHQNNTQVIYVCAFAGIL